MDTFLVANGVAFECLGDPSPCIFTESLERLWLFIWLSYIWCDSLISNVHRKSTVIYTMYIHNYCNVSELTTHYEMYVTSIDQNSYYYSAFDC